MKNMNRFAIIVALAFAFGMSGQVTAQPGAYSTSDPDLWRENYAYIIGVQAYIFGFPYVNLPMIRWAWVT